MISLTVDGLVRDAVMSDSALICVVVDFNACVNKVGQQHLDPQRKYTQEILEIRLMRS